MKNRTFVYKKNHHMIEGFIIHFIQEHNRFPLNKEISDGLKLSMRTVTRHKEEIIIGNYIPELKKLTPSIIIGLADKASKGGASEVKLWLQYVEGWGEGKEARQQKIEVTLPDIMEKQ